jgi:hypothetical protein
MLSPTQAMRMEGIPGDVLGRSNQIEEEEKGEKSRLAQEEFY